MFEHRLQHCEGSSAAAPCLLAPGEPAPAEADRWEPLTDEGSPGYLKDGPSAELNRVRVLQSCWVMFPSPSSVLEK